MSPMSSLSMPMSGADAALDAREPSLSIERSARVLPSGRDHHTTTIVLAGEKTFLYVIGGTNRWTNVLAEVLRAPIEDGTLGAFETVGMLPEPRAAHAAFVLDRRLVITGGISTSGGGMQLVSSTIVAPIEADGSLGAWTKGPSLPVPIMHHTCNVDLANVFCVGGRISGNYTGKLAVQSTMTDGVLAPFTAMPPLARTIGFHQAFVRNHFLYVAGGLHRDAPMADFERLTAITKIALDGEGQWESAGTLPDAVYVASAEVVGDRVYFLGGQDGTDAIVDTVWRGGFDGAGDVADLGVVPAKLSVARMHVHQTPHAGNRLFSAGGRDANDVSLAIVDIGTFQ